MDSFSEIFSKTENIIFLASEMIFIGLLALQLFGVGIDSDVELDLDAEVDFDPGDLADGLEGVNYPVIMLLAFFCCWFGIIGIICNSLIGARVDGMTTVQLVVASSAVSGAISYLLARKSCKLFAKVLPSVGNYAGLSSAIDGKTGRVISANITTQSYGRITVTDDSGNNYTIRAKLIDGETEVDRGNVVQIVQYDSISNSCLCRNYG